MKLSLSQLFLYLSAMSLAKIQCIGDDATGIRCVEMNSYCSKRDIMQMMYQGDANNAGGWLRE